MQLNSVPSRRRATVIQLVGGYVNQALAVVQGLLLIPLYVHFIGDRMYGLWLASGGILTGLSFFDFGISGLLTQKIAHAFGQSDLRKVARYGINGVVLSVLLSCGFAILTFILSYPLPPLLKATGDEILMLRTCFQIAGVAAALEMLNNSLRSLPQALQRPEWTHVSLAFSRITGIVATIYLLYAGYGLYAIAGGMIAMAMTAAIINTAYVWQVWRQLRGMVQLELGVLIEIMKFGPALLGGKIGMTICRSIEPTLITVFLFPEAAVGYTITKRAAEIVDQMMYVIISAVFPGFSHLFGVADENKIKRILALVVSMMLMAGLFGFAMYIFLNQDFIRLWTGSKYYLGGIITVTIALGMLSLSMYQLLSRFVFSFGAIQTVSLVNLAEAGIRFFLMVGLLLWLGVVGLPLALIASTTAFTILQMRMVKNRIGGIELDWKAATKVLATTGMVALCGMAFDRVMPPPESWLGFVGSAALLSMFFSGILYAGFRRQVGLCCQYVATPFKNESDRRKLH